MDLQDTPTMMPIASETIVIKPENQKDIKRDNQNRNVRFLIPNYVGYYLPDQSNFSAEITMEGRGNPIPSRDAGIHSMFNVVRTYDGTNSHILEEVVHYNTLVAQQFHYTKTNSLDNYRTEFEGVQPNKSIDGNIYWKPAVSPYPINVVNLPDVANPVQVVFPLKTEFYSSDQFVPCSVFNGLRLELQMEDYRRALEYTTGSLAVGFDNFICPVPSPICEVNEIAAAGGDPAIETFGVVNGGGGYDVLKIYTVSDLAGNPIGFIRPTAVNPGDNALLPGEILFHSLADGADLPDEGIILDVGLPSAGGTSGNVAGRIVVSAGVIPMGRIRVESHNCDFYVDIGAGNAYEVLALTTSPNNRFISFGEGTLRAPFRTVNPIGTNGSGYGDQTCFPDVVLPFSIGDRLHIRDLTGGGNPKVLGVITKFERVRGNLRVFFTPDIEPVIGLGNDVDNATLTGGIAGVLTGDLAFSNNLDGYALYVEDIDRRNGYSFEHITGRTKAPVQAQLLAAAQSKVDFTIKNLQYQIKRVDMDESTVSADLRAANSSQGYKLDIPTTQTRMVNLQQIQGPTSQLISIPNITKALGILSVPLNQNEQFSLLHSSLRGFPDGITNYQYDLGHHGLQPQRKVPLTKYSLGNPLVQTQHLNELMKTNEAFGYVTQNLNQLGMNFALGRQFARNDMYYNLMEAGDLTLRADFDDGQNYPKLFVHFIHHLRSIVVGQNGIQMSN